jgi:serine/threonine-protein kinase RsbW
VTILRVPADAAYGAVVRGVVAALAALDDPSIDELDDIRMAAQEGFVALLASVRDAPAIEITAERGVDDFGLEIRIDGTPAGGELDGLSMTILKSIASEVAFTDDARGRSVAVRMPLRGAR